MYLVIVGSLPIPAHDLRLTVGFLPFSICLVKVFASPQSQIIYRFPNGLVVFLCLIIIGKINNIFRRDELGANMKENCSNLTYIPTVSRVISGEVIKKWMDYVFSFKNLTASGHDRSNARFAQPTY